MQGVIQHSLLAHASYDYKLISVDVGASGRHGDAGLFGSSSPKAKMDDKSIGFPEPDVLWNNSLKCHFHVISDDAFPLRNDIMKSFPFRLSGGRRTVENAFGIMANRFRALLTKIMLDPKKAAIVVLAICCLHNMLIEEQCSYSNAFDTENQSH